VSLIIIEVGFQRKQVVIMELQKFSKPFRILIRDLLINWAVLGGRIWRKLGKKTWWVQ